ncbi:hypothetical protein QBC38DRAFT_109 [Podospora fimiseda]|uniref:Uncharacterized protein n=1 Tax=Podospora fimiseda TaxID=252190 RepID=A0AAN7C075_9PEZI|nr:hypothetical protein QBC38DRAFT_109 [Podospora fimiseda]
MPRPQDPNLYGQPPPKKQKKEMALSGSLVFTSQLNSHMATTSSSSTSGRPRPSKSKTDELFKSVKVKRKEPPSSSETSTNKLNLKSPTTTEEENATLALSRGKMESKARLYAAMKRGDYIGKEYGLVDFDRKWAESQDGKSPSSSDSDSDSEPEVKKEEPLIEHTDSFGRTRMLTASQIASLNRSALSSADLQEMSARPARPDGVIYGDAIQTTAFATTEEMQHLASKRDRSATPPPDVHYDANHEIRTKGVAFYKFSHDAEGREKEMEALKKEREQTEEVRRKTEEEKEKRKKEIEKRRKEIEERRKEMGVKRAEKIADEFLEGLGRDLVK